MQLAQMGAPSQPPAQKHQTQRIPLILSPPTLLEEGLLTLTMRHLLMEHLDLDLHWHQSCLIFWVIVQILVLLCFWPMLRLASCKTPSMKLPPQPTPSNPPSVILTPVSIPSQIQWMIWPLPWKPSIPKPMAPSLKPSNHLAALLTLLLMLCLAFWSAVVLWVWLLWLLWHFSPNLVVATCSMQCVGFYFSWELLDLLFRHCFQLWFLLYSSLVNLLIILSVLLITSMVCYDVYGREFRRDIRW